MLGIKKFVLQILLMVLGTIIVLSAIVLAGCATPNDVIEGSGSIEKTVVDDGKSQFALAAKSETDNSQTENHVENHTDNSLTIEFGDKPSEQNLSEPARQPPPELPELPVVTKDMVEKEEVSKIVDAQVKERLILVNAEAAAKVEAARARADAYVKEMEASYSLKEHELLADLANSKGRETQAEAVAKIAEVKAKAVEAQILAEGEVKVNMIRAKNENLELIIWIVGICSGFLALVFLLIRSPLDWFHKRKEQVVNGRD